METIILLLSVLVVVFWAVFNIAWITALMYTILKWRTEPVEDKRVIVGCSIVPIALWTMLFIHYFG